MTKRIYIAALLSVALISGCQKESVTEGDGTQTGGFDPKAGWEIASELENKVESFKAPEAPFEYTITYEYDKDEFCNPERGPYAPLEYHSRTWLPRAFRSLTRSSVSSPARRPTVRCTTSEYISVITSSPTFLRKLSRFSALISLSSVRPERK